MESPANQSEESRTLLFPVEIKFGDLPPVRLTNLQNQTAPPSPLQSGPSAPLSPQLRYPLSRKLPRIRVSPPSSRSFPQPSPSPETLASIAKGSYKKVPSTWCRDTKVWSRDLYLSRNSLLKKMIHQRILYRRVKPVVYSNVEEQDRDFSGQKYLGSPIDYWVIMPIQPATRLENADPTLKDVSLNKIEGLSIAYFTGPVEPSRYALNRLVGLGREPDNDGIPFRWVTNTSGTKILDRDSVMSLQIEHIIGFVECPDCGKVMCLGCLVPGRFDIVNNQLRSLAIQITKNGDKVVCKFSLGCRCDPDGTKNLGRHFISDDLNKINWMFLFLGFGIGYCTIDQLKYYCMQRKLSISESDTKNKILVTVFDDLRLQITNRPIVRE